ncbi:MAG: DUF4448 domain-containing protein, partial [Candidatus Omnitrophica bacterium]|nr:DUF4448 domain-containing protein [Candidatus Omnitrophota bacterium]
TVVQINWTPIGNWSNVKIEASTNGFIDENETFTINSSLPAGTSGLMQTYNWTVDDYISDTVRVRVSDANSTRETLVTNTSDGNFSIVGNLTVVTPNTNVTWYAGDNPILQWFANGTVGNVTIRLWDGASWRSVVNSTQTGGTGIGAGSYSNWSIPLDIKSENCRINVTDETDSTVFDSSDGDFSIRPFINVTSPVNEQNVYVLSNNSELIQWNITGTSIDFVDIWYDTEGGTGGYPYQIASRVAAAQGNYTWNNVPQRASNDVRVRVVDNTTGIPANTTVYGISASFNILGKLILQGPVGNESIVILDNQTLISWAGYNTTDMRIYYSLDGGGNWTFIKTIPDPVGSTTTYWDVNMPDACTNNARIKINATANEAINDTSSDFYLIESFDVTNPENNTVFNVSDTYDINWTRRGTTALANVSIYFDNGTGNYTLLFGGNVTNNGTRRWSVPTDVISTFCKIRVQSPINADNWNESSPAFTVIGKITLDSPDGGEDYEGGKTYPVNWSYTGPIQNVTVQYSANGTFGPWTDLAGSTPAAAGYWNWTLDENTTLSQYARIRVLDAQQPLTWDYSDDNFTTRGSYRVDTPNLTGINLRVGQQYNITWTVYGNIPKATLYYSNNSVGGPWHLIWPNITAGNQNYTWTVPDDIGNAMRVNITDPDNPNVFDFSDNNFSIIGDIILHDPNAAETDWVVGTVRSINWTPVGNFSNVQIEGSTNGFIDENETFTINASLPAGTGGVRQIYNWTVGDYISDSFRVRVKDTDSYRGDYVYNTSDGNFSLKGNLTVTNPSTNVTWYAGDTPTIQWFANGTVGNVSIRLWDGFSWLNITNFTPTGSFGYGTGSYSNWTIPLGVKSESCRINVTDASDSLVYDECDVDFHIRPRINVTSPVAEENIYVTSNYSALIQWNITGTTVDFVDVLYDIQGGTGGFPYDIARHVASGQGNVSWNNVPQRVSNDVVIRVVDNTTGVPSAVVYGDSASFNIIGKLVLTSPATNDSIPILDNQTLIQWQGYNTTDMRIYYSTDGGGGWTLIKIIPDPVGSTTTYWDVNMPDVATNLARIKINATANEAINDTSGNFSLVEVFDVTYPESGVVVVANNTYAINWTKRGTNALANVTLWFDNGTGNFTQLFGGNVTNNGTRLWQVPTDVISTNCRVRVENPLNADNYNDSSPAFTVRGNITLTSPNTGAESWDAGSTYPVTWNYDGPIQNVTIQYSYNATFGPWQNLTDSTPCDGLWNWTIPDNLTLSQVARIKIYDKDMPIAEDISDNNFTTKGALRVDDPNATGVRLGVGENYQINWTTFGNIQKVNVYYCNDSANGPWKTILTNVTASSGNLTWGVPDDISNTIRVNVTDASNAYVSDYSDYDCAIIGKLALNRPNTGEPDWRVGQVRQINWTPTGNWSYVKLEISTNGFVDENETYVVNASVPAGASGVMQTYNWTVGDYISENVRIRVSDTNVTRTVYVTNMSDGNFSLKGNLTVRVPNGTEV